MRERRPVARLLGVALGLCAAVAPVAGAAPAAGEGARDFTPLQRLEAADLVSRCLAGVMAGRPVEVAGLRRAVGPAPERVRASRGGEVWATPFGGLMLHQSAPEACAMIAPQADPRRFAQWLERWSNGPEGRMWQGQWHGRLDATAWRRFRMRGGSAVSVQAVTGAAREASEVVVTRGWGAR